MTKAALLSALVLGFLAPALMVEGAVATQDFCTVDASEFEELDASGRERRVICAEVAALDQILVYNRFGSHNPFGMIFALTRDLVPADQPAAAPPGQLAEICDRDPGIRPRPEGLVAGEVRLRDCKRPRPLTLRANVGDILHVRIRNLLRHDARDGRPDYSETFCQQGGETGGGWRAAIRAAVSEGTRAEDGSQDLAFTDAGGAGKLVAALCDGGSRDRPARLVNGPEATDWPRTRGISFVIDGLRPLRDPATGVVDDVCLGLGQLAPGSDHVDCYWHAEREGPYFVNSIAAPSGGEGDGGSLAHGLFGSLAVEPQAKGAPATQWYRSQTSRAAFDEAWQPADYTPRPHDRSGTLNYEATVPAGGEDVPVLNLLKRIGGERYELVHNDLNAIIRPAGEPAFREFSVLFHDELKTFYTRNFEELGRFPQLAGVADGFAINYGASGLGAMILANRKGIGPAGDCMECLYEEFFLESWANGDPALLEGYSDDPSNVHHAYLNDPVVFRNYHAGPKETHVFHLHAHQWFAGNDSGRGAYLDSQTVAPRQGFTYRVYHGGLRHYTPEDEAPGGWWESLGSGNRSRTVGDSIFHCHLYPHFAQGMWALWRVHDVLEDGTRRLPDGQAAPGLSTELLERDADGRLAPVMARSGSVGREGRFIADAEGTPIPAVIPLPDGAAPLLPTYASGDGDDPVPAEAAVPGYPFFVAGRPGHRPPQPPLDMATDTGSDSWLDGGLPRHVVAGGSRRALGVSTALGDLGVDAGSPSAERRRVEDTLYRLTAKMLALGDFSGHLTEAGIDILDNRGEPLERGAMGFHHNGTVEGRPLKLRDARGAETSLDGARGGYLSAAPNADADGAVLAFPVNGAPPKPGAPFADPCGAPDAYAGRSPAVPDAAAPPGPLALRADPFVPDVADFVPDSAVNGFRRYEVSAVQVDIVTNKAGWHDPQGRINVLTSVSDDYKDRGPSAREEPFFFRAYSGECVEFRHTNELPKELELDDFQVQTPTDTIGQHIHLVKFDVTASDGSGNGWNYEDGTFSPDEITLRLCAMLDPASETPAIGAGSTVPAGSKIAAMTEADWRAICEPVEVGGEIDHWAPIRHDWWAAPRGKNPERFQTTVQRWFADPILAIEGEADDPEEMADRTLRTVFTHDHFAPSSIQQHGFYSALVIEPVGKEVCPGLVMDGETCMETEPEAAGFVQGGPGGVGVHKIVANPLEDSPPDDPELGTREIHPDYREFALAIADFALLYDPTDGEKDDLIAAAGPLPGGAELAAPPAEDPTGPVEASPKGLAKLVCEAEHRSSALGTASESTIERLCASPIERGRFDGNLLPIEAEAVPPALVARDLILPGEVPELRRHFALVRYRAGYGEGLARPVNAPERPEAISVDHHDPYLVNYRGEPVPLRIGDTGEPDESGQEEGGYDPEPAEEADAVERVPIEETETVLWRTAATGGMPEADTHGEDPAAKAPDAEAPDADGSRRTAFECFADADAGVLGQFRRRDGTASGPGPAAIPRPGEAVEFTPELEQALAAADLLDCSIDSQSPDPRGNLAHVYRSEFFDDELQPDDAPHAEPPPFGGDAETLDPSIRNRAHGDPATPLLETYSEERVQIRLVQGAQEVQHTFALEGLQWRRHIDQKFPSASKPLDTDYATQTWWQECRDHGRKGIARQHDRWRNGLLKPEDDTAFWQEHSERVALCDNLEGFVAAQEVGISEHFEIPAAPSKESVQVRFAPSGAALMEENDEKSAALDYLFHFGSQDAIWNGAWGLMRVYDTEDARDETRRIENPDDRACVDLSGSDCRVTEVLKPLPDPEERAQRLAARAVREPLALQPAACPADAPRIEAFAVAMPLPSGQSYASWRDGFGDMDALALVHVPKDLVSPWLASGIVPEAEIEGLRRAALPYYGDEPLVIRANAGDCLRLSIINALAPAPANAVSCGHAPNGDPGPVRDCLGDAEMPRIVKLNVEPNWADASADAAGPLRMVQQDRIDVRPSARIAFVTPMSMLTRGGRAHLPFGVNRTTSEAPGAIQVADYYLGLLRVDWKLIDFLMASSPIDDASEINVSNALQQCRARGIKPGGGEGSTPDSVATAQAILDGDDPDYYVLTGQRERSGGAGTFQIDLLGATYWGSIRQRTEATRPLSVQVLDDVARMTIDCMDMLLETQGLGNDLPDQALYPQPEARPVHAIPYAFGAVPLKPMADFFNQLPHGLFGTLVVEPQGATYPGREVRPDGGVYTPQRPRIAGAAHRGHGANTSISFVDGDGNPRRLREFVLFYQDGLNLWDRGSGNRWLPIDAFGGRGLPIVGGCPVCDDSYDLGEQAVSYRAPAFHRRLRQTQGVAAEAHNDLNAYVFETDFRAQKSSLSSNSLRLWALPGEEVVVRVVHPGGRARQRAFVTVGNDYDDLFPGFGFPHSGLLAPGKALTAAFSAPVRPGCYIWSDGPRQIEAAGAWGVLDVLTEAGRTSCEFLD